MSTEEEIEKIRHRMAVNDFIFRSQCRYGVEQRDRDYWEKSIRELLGPPVKIKTPRR